MDLEDFMSALSGRDEVMIDDLAKEIGLPVDQVLDLLEHMESKGIASLALHYLPEGLRAAIMWS